jgi:hypothetical protein
VPNSDIASLFEAFRATFSRTWGEYHRSRGLKLFVWIVHYDLFLDYGADRRSRNVMARGGDARQNSLLGLARRFEQIDCRHRSFSVDFDRSKLIRRRHHAGMVDRHFLLSWINFAVWFDITLVGSLRGNRNAIYKFVIEPPFFQ